MQSLIDRRSALAALAGAASGTMFTASAAPDEPKPRLVAWMYMIYPLEQWLTDYDKTLDAWEAGERTVL